MIAKTAKDSLKLAKRLYPFRSRKHGCNVLIVSIPQPDGSEKIVARGPTNFALRKAHALGRCGAFCGYCYHDMEQFMKANPNF